MQSKMLKNFIIGFLPWILYFVFVGNSQSQINLAVISALAAFLVFSRREIKKGFVLAWGTLLFFSAMLIAAVILKNDWVIQHAWVFSNGTLALIAWVSLLIGKPFTSQYAREEVDADLWQHPVFIKINNILTAVWGVIFTFSTFVHIIGVYFPTAPHWLYDFLSNAASVFGVIFTIKFPEWYKQFSLERLRKKNSKNNYYLKNNFAPVLDELDVKDLEVIGEIPKDLRGVYMRNGPNPAFPTISYTYPFDGDGMIHAVYIENGKAQYRNRYVETKALKAEKRAGKAIYGGIMHPVPADPKYFASPDEVESFKNGAFIHIIRHANHYLAMSEAAPAYEMTKELATLGEWCPGTEKPIAASPHTRFDWDTGDLWLINYDLEPPYLSVLRVDVTGKLQQKIDVGKPRSTMMHDFILTKNYVVFFDCPLVFEIENAKKGKNILTWQPELGTRIGIMPRNGTQVKWFVTEPFFVFHFANAYEQGDEIIIDYIRHEKLNVEKITDKSKPPALYQTRLNLTSQVIKHLQLADYLTEFPRFNDLKNSQEYQYIYSAIKTNSNPEFNGLMKFDRGRNKEQILDLGKNIEIDEAIFVASNTAKSEDDGYLMFFVYDKTTNNSVLQIHDAKDLSCAPLAQIKMPRRVPHGLHGSWSH